MLCNFPRNPSKFCIFLKKFTMRLFSLLILLAITQTTTAQVLIKNVTVVDVEKKKLLSGYNVLAQEGKIIAVDKGKTYKLPEGTTVIDGTGKYIVPGFTDAHVHFFQSGGLFTRPDAIDLRAYQPYAKELNWVHNNMDDFLRRYSSVGITQLVDVGASYNFLKQRDSFTNKKYAPLISMTGPAFTYHLCTRAV
jgi:formylmethanofuran dehydrogenase subunit A